MRCILTVQLCWCRRDNIVVVVLSCWSTVSDFTLRLVVDTWGVDKVTRRLACNVSTAAPFPPLCGVNRHWITTLATKCNIYRMWRCLCYLPQERTSGCVCLFVCVCVLGASGSRSWKRKHEVWNRPVLLLWSHGSQLSITRWDSTRTLYWTHTHT